MKHRIAIEAGMPLFLGWIPGQVPGGKNQTVLRDKGDGRLGTMPRRRSLKRKDPRTGKMIRVPREGPEPFEAWRRGALKLFPLLSGQAPKLTRDYLGRIRLIADYWWDDEIERDEDGRKGAIGHVLQHGCVIRDDAQLRQVWRYPGQDHKTPGLLFAGFAEAEVCPSPKIPNPAEDGSADRYGLSKMDRPYVGWFWTDEMGGVTAEV